MSEASTNVGGQYEFSDDQNRLFANLSRKMALVGFAAMFFGGLQMFNGIAAIFAGGHPEKIIAAAKEAGLPAERVQQLERALASDGWLSPWRVSAIVTALTGLILVMVGLWTQQAAGGFAAIVVTKGQDIQRLLDALGALYKKYSTIYTILMAAAIASLISFGFTLYRLWAAKG